ncbi:MAG TPA: hypothetical protein V6C58_15090, partial [Allocoleopsis sp.]
MNKLAGAQKLINFKDAVLAQQDLIKLQVINQGFVLSTNKIELEKLDLIAQSNGFLNDELMRKKETIELDNNRLSFQQKALEISSQLVSAEASYNDAVKSGDKSRADISLTRKNNLLESLRLEEKSKAVNDERIVQANRLLKIERDLKYDLEEIEKSYTQQLNIQSRLETSAKLREIELDLQREMGELTEREYAAKKSAINLLNIENTKNKELLQLDKARDEIEKNRVANLAKLSAGPESDKDRERINANAASALSKVNTDAAGINAIYEATRKANLEITAFNDSLMLMDELSESLSVVFGDLGSSIGQFAKAMVQSTKALENLNKREEDLIRIKSDLQDAGDTAGEKKAEKELLNIQSKKIDILGKEAGIAKKMFGEKTAAYKVLSGLEKAAHIQKIAFAAVELVTTAKTTYANIAAAVSSIWKTAPWFVAPVVTGAFLGLMASLGFGGGGSVSIPKGFSAEDRQEVQGTGAQAWDKSGNRVQTGGGALGEEEEKSDAIVNSIDLIEKHTFESLEFSNSMLSALKSIEKNTQNMVKAAIALPGNIRLADPTREGGNFINKKKVETADKGINISGSIDKLIDGVGKFETYINSVVTSKKWFGLKTSTRTETSTSPLQDETFIKAVGSTIAAGKKSLIEAGKALGMTGVESIIGGMDIKLSVSALGKTGEEFAQEVLAELGIQLDLAAEKAFPGLKKFQQLGESYAETAFRMARTSQLVNQGMTLMGMAITKLPEVVGTATEEMYTAVSTASKNLDTAKAKVDSLKDGSWVDVWVEMSDAGGQWTKQLVVDYAALSQAEKDVIDATNKLTEAQNTLN